VAVFGETYPDPVRVISVGAPVDDLLENPMDAAWGDLSIEFCGGTHLSNTAHAGNFAIVEEGSVAKGIRRVTCVTREKATEACDRLAELEGKMSAARSLSGKELEAAKVALTEEISAATIPAAGRQVLLAGIKELEKRVAAEMKAAAAAAGAAAAQTIEAAAAAAGDAGFVVVRADGISGKVPQQVVKKLQKTVKDKGVCVMSAVGPKMLTLAYVPKGVTSEKGVSAQDWLAAVNAVTGGRGGGKGDSAQGFSDFSDDGCVAAMAAATEWGTANL
jgi:alanyl-tRNA synthetase